MTTALVALEALRATCEELAATNRTEALDMTAGDDESRAQAVGAAGVYQALAKRIAAIQAEGFTDEADGYRQTLMAAGRLMVRAATHDGNPDEISLELGRLLLPYMSVEDVILRTDSKPVQ